MAVDQARPQGPLPRAQRAELLAPHLDRAQDLGVLEALAAESLQVQCVRHVFSRTSPATGLTDYVMVCRTHRTVGAHHPTAFDAMRDLCPVAAELKIGARRLRELRRLGFVQLSDAVSPRQGVDRVVVVE